MRCPHCAGEIHAGSRFCGLCGRTLSAARSGTTAASSAASSLSLFELPTARRDRTSRVVLVLVLDAILAAAGVTLAVASRGTGSVAAAVADAGAAAGPRRDAGSLASRIESEPPVVVPSRAYHPPRPSSASASGSPVPVPAPVPALEPAPPSPGAPVDAGAVAPPPPAPSDAAPVASPPAVAPPGDGGPEESAAGNLAAALALEVAQHDGPLQRCYERAAKVASSAEPLAGTVSLRFTMVPGGGIERVSVVGNDTGSPQLAACVAALVETWRVPPGPDAPLEFEWPLRFAAR